MTRVLLTLSLFGLVGFPLLYVAPADHDSLVGRPAIVRILQADELGTLPREPIGTLPRKPMMAGDWRVTGGPG
jgi:hypothetical protein